MFYGIGPIRGRSSIISGKSSASVPVARAGLSLVEILVVMTISGVLLALLIPAVRSARESGRIASCQNNLRQIGLALEMHFTAKESYPVDGENGYGVCTFLLPYVEQQHLYDRLQPEKRWRPIADVNRSDLGGAALSVFRCPSVGGEGTTKLRLGRSSYLGTNYMFPWKTAQVEIRDGASNTIAVGETLAEHAWILPGTANAVPPNSGGHFQSDHDLGAHFVFCDGSVHFIDEAIDPKVFRALCTIAGGETVSDWRLSTQSQADFQR